MLIAHDAVTARSTTSDFWCSLEDVEYARPRHELPRPGHDELQTAAE